MKMLNGTGHKTGIFFIISPLLPSPPDGVYFIDFNLTYFSLQLTNNLKWKISGSKLNTSIQNILLRHPGNFRAFKEKNKQSCFVKITSSSYFFSYCNTPVDKSIMTTLVYLIYICRHVYK